MLTANIFVVLSTVLFPCTLVLTYTLAFYNKHVDMTWPYISHTGNYPLESCFFSLGLNVVSALYAIIVYLRYVQVSAFFPTEKRKPHRLNKSALVFGLLSSISLSAASSFQQKNATHIHRTFAATCSFAAFVYFWHQTVLSYMGVVRNVHLKAFRLFLSVLSTLAHFIGLCLFIYWVSYRVTLFAGVMEWSEGDDIGFRLYQTGSILEWIVFVTNILYIASFYNEFKRVVLMCDEIALVGD